MGDPNSSPDPDGTRADMGAYYFHQETNSTFEQSVFENILFYPNPTSDLIKIDFKIDSFKPLTYTLISLEGRVIEKNILPESTELNLQSLSAGLYFIKIEGSNQQEVFKIVKQ